MELRAYQQEAARAVLNEWRSVRRTLLVLPTGTGKTVIFAKLTEALVRAQKRVLILAHRKELIDQACDKLWMATGVVGWQEIGDDRAPRDCAVVVASVQTIGRESRLKTWAPDHFDVIIIDEAHHVLADSYQRIINHFADARMLGVTATPDRGDKRGLAQVFESIAYEYRLAKAIKDKWLVPIKALTLPLAIDMTKCHTVAGDYSMAEIGGILRPYLRQIALHIDDKCAHRKTVVFTPRIDISTELVEELQSLGVPAAEINGKSRDRDQILADFRSGHYRVLCNSMLLTEGWDEPTVDCIVCLRPTKIRALYAQIVGRGTRLAPGKSDLLLLDFLWHSENHNLCRPGSLIAEKDIAAKAADKCNSETDIFDAVAEAERDEIDECNAKLAERLHELRHRKKKLVDPLQFALSICDTDLTDYRPAFGWEFEPITDKQAAVLESAGIDHEIVESKGHATVIIDRIIERRKQGLATPKQVRMLERRGFDQVGLWSFEQANNVITALQRNNWRMSPIIKSMGAKCGTT